MELLKTFRAEFIEITPGVGKYPKSFRMGRDGGEKEELPAHSVTFDHGFSIAKYEVPQNLWTAVMGENPSRWKGARNSVEMLSFAEAQDFCRKATDLMRTAKLIAANETIRLPSEAEWEYAARAGTKSLYSFGDDRTELGKYGWSTENAAGNDPPVGAKQPNPWGLYDVHGYLWEWCLDPWHPDYRGAPVDGSTWEAGGDKSLGVARGGSWKNTGDKLTSSHRQSFPRDARDDALGLRCVLARPR
jgi:formylglycine-generating enzyme required for sulfatase activity